MSIKLAIADRHLDGTCQRASDGRHCHCALETYKINTGQNRACCVTGCGWGDPTKVAVEVTRETMIEAGDLWEGDQLRLGPNLFAKVTSVEHVNTYTSCHYVKIRTDEGDELILNPRSVRVVKITFITSRP